MSSSQHTLKLSEKLGYALGDGAANIAWRGVSTFLFIFYTDVYGLDPAAVGLLMLVARSGDGISDIFMGILGDRTKSKHGRFRPWILWSAVPLGLILSLLFTTPDLNDGGKLIYAYITYILFTLIYTANNVPYGALMAVMTPCHQERTVLGSYRMAGAFVGGMVVQGTLLALVLHFGNVNPEIKVEPLAEVDTFKVTLAAPVDVASASIKTENGIGQFTWADATDGEKSKRVSFALEANQEYSFIVSNEANLTADDISLINQKQGYQYSMYIMSALLTIFVLITFLTTKERVVPPKDQKSNLSKDLKDLISNKPWLILLGVGLLFNVYNSVKQGITVIYFVHYIHNELLAGTYLVALMLASIVGAISVAVLSKKWGKKKLFIYALIFSGAVNTLFMFCGPTDIAAIFVIGVVSEFASAMFPTLFFAMLGDAADYSQWKNGRRATGLVYSAGSFATKFGGGLAAVIIGFVLSAYQYDGQSEQAIQGAIPGIIMLMSWVPAVIAIVTSFLIYFYPLGQDKMDEISVELYGKPDYKGDDLTTNKEQNSSLEPTLN
jgi:GPH family glycoside/pentoside/hexuronide:cation symporter